MFQDILIIGRGRFGKTLESLLINANKSVVCADKGDALPEKAFDLVFLCIPISSLESALGDLAEYLKAFPPKLLADVLSVKNYAKDVFERQVPSSQPCMLSHPMFGPDSANQSDKIWMFDEYRSNTATTKAFVDLLVQLNCKSVAMSCADHDSYAAQSQGITHFVGRMLEAYDLTPTPIDTLGAKKLFEIKNQVCNDTWELFSDLQTKNPFTPRMRGRLRVSLDKTYEALLPKRVHPDKLVIGIQGGRGSFNEEAALFNVAKKKIESFELLYLHTTKRVLEAVTTGQADVGQFAIHNSIGGIVHESIDAMALYNFSIMEELFIPIAHALMIHPEASYEDVTTIMTHPQVLKQCAKHLKEQFPHLIQTSGEGELIDHAKVAEKLMEKELPLHIATMGSKQLAVNFNLKVVAENLQDLDNNLTSFLWVERIREYN